MRLISYYVVHTFINNIKRLFRTWLAILIGMFAVFGLIGGIAAFTVMVVMNSQKEPAPDTEPGIVSETEGVYEDEGDIPYDAHEEEKEEEISRELFESAAGGIIFIVILAFILFAVYTGDKSGSSIFEMADVNLLFTSPMRPQSVLAFRLFIRASTMLLGSLYLLGQIASLHNAGFSGWGIAAVFFGYFVMLMIAQLMGVVTYTLVANSRSEKRVKGRRVFPLSLNRVLVIAILGLILLWLFYLYRIEGLGFKEVFMASFGAPFIRHVPLIGWLTSFVLYANAHEFALAIVHLLLVAAGMGLLAVIIWRIPAFFYEDALPGAEKNTARYDQKKNANALQSDKKRRLPARLAGREAVFRYGKGASVFFFRNLHHRFRAGAAGVINQDSIAFFVIFAGYTFICMRMIGTNIAFPAFLILLFISLFKAFSNPLAEELNGHLLMLTPDDLWKKLVFAITSGIVNYVIDIIPGMIVMMVFLKPDMGECALFFFLLICAQFYGDSLSLFIRMVLPPRLDETVYAMFYFGLLTIGLAIPFLVVVISIALSHMTIGVIIAAVFMLALTAASFAAGTALLMRGQG